MLEIHASIASTLLARWPDLHSGWLTAEIRTVTNEAEIARELERTANKLAEHETLETIAAHPIIAATRALYRACGKDPSRYRPAAEQLRRRAVRGLGPRPVAPLVDLVNLASLRTGLSMSACDLDSIQGNITWGIGQPDEPYEAIGRGPMNIAGLPVWRDDIGAFASPTSDSVRTCVRPQTTRVLILLHGPATRELLHDTLRHLVQDLEHYTEPLQVRFGVV